MIRLTFSNARALNTPNDIVEKEGKQLIARRWHSYYDTCRVQTPDGVWHDDMVKIVIIDKDRYFLVPSIHKKRIFSDVSIDAFEGKVIECFAKQKIALAKQQCA